MDVWLGAAGLAWLASLCWVPRRGPLVSVLWRLVGRLGTRLADRRVRRQPAPDPFAVIELQQRLGILSGQIRRLEGEDKVFAKGQRLIAHRAAYDDLLDEAFTLAGLPLPPHGRGEARRLDAELELAARGWSW